MTTLREQADDFFNQPGRLYQTGNWIALAVSVEQFAVAAIHSSGSAWHVVSGALIGTATLVFKIGSGHYNAAFANPQQPDPNENRKGHIAAPPPEPFCLAEAWLPWAAQKT